jgi:hypothetical protein
MLGSCSSNNNKTRTALLRTRPPVSPSIRSTLQKAGSSTPLPLLSTHTDRLPSAAPTHTLCNTALLLPPLLLPAECSLLSPALALRSATLLRREPKPPAAAAAAAGGGGASAGCCSGTRAKH